jgi:dTDP-4-dehydrorhamnose reductase
VDQERWLVTGAQGFLGSNAGKFLWANGIPATGVVRGGNAPQFDSVVQGDLTVPGYTAAVIEKEAPNVILHCAAVSSHPDCEANPELAFRVNAQACGEIARAAENIGATLIYISTDSVFDGQRGNYSETDPTNPFSVYGETKLQGEHLVLAETNALVIRTNFFGWSPTNQRSILEFFVKNLEQGKQVPGYTNVTTTSLYAQTLLTYIWQLHKSEQSGIFHVTSLDALTKREYGQLVADTFALNSALIQPTESEQPRNISLDTTKLAHFLGHSPQTQLAGLRRAAEQRPEFC